MKKLFFPVHGRWGFIDKTGMMIIEPHFDWVLPFSEGLALLEPHPFYYK